MRTLPEADCWEAGLYVPPARARLRGTSVDPLEFGQGHKGRHSDITGGYSFPVEVRKDPSVAEAHKKRDALLRSRSTPKTWQTAHGTAQRHGLQKTCQGTCAECGSEFVVSRPVSQSRKWPSVCSDDCRRVRRARLKRVRVRL